MTPEDATEAAEQHAEQYQHDINAIATQTMANAVTYVCADLLRAAQTHPLSCPCSSCALIQLIVTTYDERAPSS